MVNDRSCKRARCNPSYDACGKLLTLLSTKLSARVARGVFMMVGDKSGAFRVPDFCDCRRSFFGINFVLSGISWMAISARFSPPAD